MYLLIRLAKLYILLNQVTFECSTLTVYPHWIYSIDIKNWKKIKKLYSCFLLAVLYSSNYKNYFLHTIKLSK